jgi:hypothetical protein
MTTVGSCSDVVRLARVAVGDISFSQRRLRFERRGLRHAVNEQRRSQREGGKKNGDLIVEDGRRSIRQMPASLDAAKAAS